MPGYATETQQDPLLILDTRSGKETEELEQDSTGCCGKEQDEYLGQDFTSSVALSSEREII